MRFIFLSFAAAMLVAAAVTSAAAQSAANPIPTVFGAGPELHLLYEGRVPGVGPEHAYAVAPLVIHSPMGQH